MLDSEAVDIQILCDLANNHEHVVQVAAEDSTTCALFVTMVAGQRAVGIYTSAHAHMLTHRGRLPCTTSSTAHTLRLQPKRSARTASAQHAAELPRMRSRNTHD